MASREFLRIAAKMAAETPAVDANLIPVLEQKAAMSIHRVLCMLNLLLLNLFRHRDTSNILSIL